MRRIILLGLFFAMPSVADDTLSIDAIIDAYYAVISGPQGHVYDAQRDASIHAEGALITKFLLDGSVHRHDLATEQATIVSPYEAPFFEFETDRRVERTENIAHVWSDFEVRSKPQGEVLDRGVNSISLFFRDQRWWISSWSTQYTEARIEVSEAAVPAQLTDLNTDQFAEVVKTIVQDTLQACEVQGAMEGRAKMNLAVVGEVNAKLVCSSDQ